MYTDKSPLDRTNDCLLVMMDYISQLETRFADWTDQIEPTLDDKAIMKLSGLMSDLDEIWSQISHWEISRACDDLETDPYSSEYVYTYTNAYQANSVAIHSLARLILLLLLGHQTSSSYFALPADQKDKVEKMTHASTSIISAAACLSTFDIGCAYLRIITPLQIVAQYSPRRRQRDCAVQILQQWWAERPLKGLTWKALQPISLSNKKSTFLVGG
jgi:flagellin-specific chaperone FliS